MGNVSSIAAMLGAGNIFPVLLFVTYTGYTCVAGECGYCQWEFLGTCYEDGDKLKDDPYCLGCTKTKFYEVKFSYGSPCPSCARENNVEKICEPDPEKTKSDKECKKCLATTTTTTTTTSTTSTTTPMDNKIIRDPKHKDNSDAASVNSIGYLFLLPIVILTFI